MKCGLGVLLEIKKIKKHLLVEDKSLHQRRKRKRSRSFQRMNELILFIININRQGSK